MPEIQKIGRLTDAGGSGLKLFQIISF